MRSFTKIKPSQKFPNLQYFWGSCIFVLLSTDFFLTFKKNLSGNTIRMSNGLHPDQDQCTVSPDPDSNFHAQLR